MNGRGGDTLNEGIFHSDSLTFLIKTAQYDVWAWDKDSNAYKKYVGHCPPDSMMGVNFTIFGRVRVGYSKTTEGTNIDDGNKIISISHNNDIVIARLLLKSEGQAIRVEIYDILGRIVGSNENFQSRQDLFDVNCKINQQLSGTYICRIIGKDFVLSKTFQIIQ